MNKIRSNDFELATIESNQQYESNSKSSDDSVKENFFKKAFNLLIVRSCWSINNKLVNKFTLFILFSILFWMVSFIFLGDSALPGGTIFSLEVILISSHVLGFLCELIKLPSLLG